MVSAIVILVFCSFTAMRNHLVLHLSRSLGIPVTQGKSTGRKHMFDQTPTHSHHPELHNRFSPMGLPLLPAYNTPSGSTIRTSITGKKWQTRLCESWVRESNHSLIFLSRQLKPRFLLCRPPLFAKDENFDSEASTVRSRISMNLHCQHPIGGHRFMPCCSTSHAVSALCRVWESSRG